MISGAIADKMEEEGVSFSVGAEQVRAKAVFTTYTPVPAWHDRFPEGLIVEHLGSLQQRSYVHAYPKYLLSWLMRCGLCGRFIILASGKSDGYYGCLNTRRGTCQNRFMINRRKIEQVILKDLKKNILTVDRVDEAFKKLEEAEAAQVITLPALLKDKESELAELKRMIANCLDFVKAGNASKSVAEEIQVLENKTGELQTEIETLKSRMANRFKAPSREWIESRLARLKQALEAPNAASTIKELMAPIILKPAGTYYTAHATIRISVLLDPDRTKSFPKNDEGAASDIPVAIRLS